MIRLVNQILLVAILVFEIQEYRQSKPDPPPTKKYCTIKLNDVNKSTSYLTGECINNE